MSRRKKRQKAASQKTPAPALSNVPSPMLALDKSLPSLPKDDDPPPPLPIQARPQTSRTSSSKSSAPDQLSPISYNHPTAGKIYVPVDLGPANLASAGIGDNLRTPRTASNNRNSQASQLSLDMGQSMGNDYSFIPLVLDNSPGPSPVPLPNTAYNRSGVQNESYYRSERDYPRPSYDRKTSNASSHYEPERDRNARPHIATQDRSYDLQVGYDRNEPSRGSHDSERVSDKADSDSIYMKNEAQIARDYLRSQEVEKTLGPSINIENQPSHFKLHDVPRERKKSVGTLIKSLEVEEQREKSRSSSPVRGIANPPPRGDSFRPPTVRTESPVSGVSARIKAFETPIVTAPSPNNRSYAASGGSNSSSTTIESPETPITSKDSKYSTKSELTLSTFGSSPVQAPRPSPPRRPSTAQESTFSESYSEASPILPGYKSPIGGFGEEVSRAFDGAGGILGRFSGSVKHGRSLSEATKQSPKWPRSPSSGHYLPNFNDISGPMSPGGDDVVSLRQEVRRSNQRVAELEARLNVC